MVVQDGAGGSGRPHPVRGTMGSGWPSNPTEAADVRLWRALRALRLRMPAVSPEADGPNGTRELTATVAAGGLVGTLVVSTPVVPRTSQGDVPVGITMTARLQAPGVRRPGDRR